MPYSIEFPCHLPGVDQNDREFRKVEAWFNMAEAKEKESDAAPPSFLEIPTIVFNGEDNDDFGRKSSHMPMINESSPRSSGRKTGIGHYEL